MATLKDIQQQAKDAVAALKVPTADFSKAIKHWGENERREAEALSDMVTTVCDALEVRVDSPYRSSVPQYKKMIEAIEAFDAIEIETQAARRRSMEALEQTRDLADQAREAVNKLFARAGYEMAAESIGVVDEIESAAVRLRDGKLPKTPADFVMHPRPE